MRGSGAREASRVARIPLLAALRLFEGGPKGPDRPCRAMSHHGFLGIEELVVDAIAAFIRGVEPGAEARAALMDR